jgi:phosphoribosyl-AMP cyclohydrolase / phosphoribosyl-ATP pyrophosphohydrolase
MNDLDFLIELQSILAKRLEQPSETSYTARLASQGTAKVAQKVGEEAVELALAAVSEDVDSVRAEAADLLFHMMLLLKLRGLGLSDVVGELEARHRARLGAS